MSFQRVADPITTTVTTPEDYHYTVQIDNLIWFFSRKYEAQPQFNWGHRVTYIGGYAVAFNVDTNKWEEKVEFPALSTEENTSEVLFEFAGAVHLLLSANFGSISFNKLFKWDGKQWIEVELESPEPIATSDNSTRLEVIVAAGTSSDKFLVVSLSATVHLFKLAMEDGKAVVEHEADIPEELNHLRGQAISAVHSGRRLLIAYGVHGCGFRWEKHNLLTYDEDTKESHHITVPGDFNTGPKFGGVGANGLGVAPNGDWIHASGFVQEGMTGGKFDGSTWSLTNLATEPEWVLKAPTVPEENSSDVVVDTNTGHVYAFGKSSVVRSQI